MLRETQLSVDSVSKLCGFSSRHYFHTLFKRRTGMTPAAFRVKKS
jgi:AraC-like DNA-binding protein